MATIVHFEIPADDLDRARRFYSDLFGWKVEQIADTCYFLVKTSGENPVHGGMMQRQDPRQQIINYIDVTSVDDYTSRIKELGGQIIMSKTAVPEMGYFAICLDTENNAFGIWEQNKEAK